MNLARVGIPFFVKIDVGTLTGLAAGFSYSVMDSSNGLFAAGTSAVSEPDPGFYTFPVTLAAVGDYVVHITHATAFVGRLAVPVRVYAEDFDTLALEASVQAGLSDVGFIKSMIGGRWQIINNQMVFYDLDNVTEVARFDLKDAGGQPTEVDVMQRVKK